MVVQFVQQKGEQGDSVARLVPKTLDCWSRGGGSPYKSATSNGAPEGQTQLVRNRSFDKRWSIPSAEFRSNESRQMICEILRRVVKCQALRCYQGLYLTSKVGQCKNKRAAAKFETCHKKRSSKHLAREKEWEMRNWHRYLGRKCLESLKIPHFRRKDVGAA